MSENKITYEDVKEYEKFFTLIPPFLLERFAKKNKNIVLKFKSKAESYLGRLNDHQKSKLDIVLNSDVDELQRIMNEAYSRSNKKQYKILGNPKYKQFVEDNLNEVRKMVYG
ncbi:hypothetical protein [Methanobrevibacter sp.]|uniref:hypothetical protein n=1 Tax=Methanobrevibacter sp. TaxID=66852 RepID=UPI00388E5F80